MSNTHIFDDIKNIIIEKDINIQFKNIIKMYESMNFKNEILIQYKINKDAKKINLFGAEFVRNNKNICKYIHENKEYELSKHFVLTDIDKLKDIFEIKLIGIKDITDMSYLFDNIDFISFETIANTLINIPDISEWDTSHVTKMNDIFSNCKLLKSLPDISKWDTSNVTNMNTLFWCCESLISLPDISKWDTSKVNDMHEMFGNCRSLKSLPDISK